jgi:Mitochondrial carrier protein
MIPEGKVYRGTYSAFIGTLQETGIRGLYRGLSVALVGGIPGSVLYFTGYETSKAYLTENNVHPFLAYTMSGMMAEAVCCSFFVPVDVIKERLQVYQPSSSSTKSHHSVVYNGGLDALLKISKAEGIRGLYKGYVATVLSFGPFSSIYFLGYELIKKRFSTYENGRPNFLMSLSAAASAGAFAAYLTTPLDLIKLRMQISFTKQSTVYFKDIFWQIYSNEGTNGLFKGAGARVMYYTPSSALSMAIFEHLKSNPYWEIRGRAVAM